MKGCKITNLYFLLVFADLLKNHTLTIIMAYRGLTFYNLYKIFFAMVFVYFAQITNFAALKI